MNKVETGYLYAYYGKLLNKYQFEIMRLYYDCDMSLAEISNQREITRQGVRDVIVRSKKKLIDFEKKLGVVRKTRYLTKELEAIIEEADGNTKEKLKSILTDIKEI